VRPPVPGGPGPLTAAVFAAMFLAYGAQLPFWPLWLERWGLTQGEIGLYLGAAIVARLAGGVIAPWLADLTGRRRTALALLALAGAAIFLAHPFAGDRATLFVLTLAWATTFAASLPIADALASAAAARHGFSYARARAAGSAAFLFANLACGAAVGFWGPDAALVWIVVSLCAVAALAGRHPGGAPGGAERAGAGEALVLLRARPFALAAAASAALQAAHGPLYAYGSIHWRGQGLGEATIGALWAAGVAAEVALMVWAGGRLTRRLGPAGLFALSGAAGLARWAAMAAEPTGVWLWLWQATHALTFAPAHLGMIAFVAAAAPARLAASAQGLIGAGAGNLAMAGATFAAAALYPVAGPWMYGVGVALSAAGLAAAAALARGWDGRPVT
jgi:PPP family 3-phenylpropionic acid transporter